MDNIIDVLFQEAVGLGTEAVKIWLSGGWAMVAIALLAVLLFAIGMHVFLRLRFTGYLSIAESVWRKWIEHPAERRGPVGDILDLVTGEAASLEDTRVYFRQLRTTDMAPFERELRVMRVCVGAAPLVGLLGTVTGMLATFNALSSGSGGEKTMEMVAAGISEALITTETGLVVALTGLFFQYLLDRTFGRCKAFLERLETVCTQKLHRVVRGNEEARVYRVAQERVVSAFSEKLRERALG